jgi:hypothetical protein
MNTLTSRLLAGISKFGVAFAMFAIPMMATSIPRVRGTHAEGATGLWMTVISIAVFRRIARIQSEKIAIKAAESQDSITSRFGFYLSVYGRIWLRYLWVFVLAIAIKLLTNEARMDTISGAMFGLLVGSVFALDIPARAFSKIQKGEIQAVQRISWAWSMVGVFGIGTVFYASFIFPRQIDAYLKAHREAGAKVAQAAAHTPEGKKAAFSAPTEPKQVPDLETNQQQTGDLLVPTPKQIEESKANIAKGERWEFPIKLGSGREYVYEAFGQPTGVDDKGVAAWRRLEKRNPEYYTKETQFWVSNGVTVQFKEGIVDNLIIHKEYKGVICYDLRASDKLDAWLSKLGTPNSQIQSSDEFKYFNWRVGSYSISQDFCVKEAMVAGRYYMPADGDGNIRIEDLRPILMQEEKRRRHDEEIVIDQKRQLERVSLSGSQITPKEIFQRYSDRVFVIRAYNSKGKVASFGTGFLIGGYGFLTNYIVTNYHIVEHARKITYQSIKDGSKEAEIGVSIAHKNSDLAILNHWLPPEERKPNVQIAENAETGDSVTVIGNPEGLEGSLTTGVVSSTRSDGESTLIQISAPISHGSSGSPVFDSCGRWIGLATLFFKDGQNLNFAIPSNSIIEKIKKAELGSEYDELTKSKYLRDAELPLKGYLSSDAEYRAIHEALLDNISGNYSESVIRENTLKLNKFLEAYPDPSDQDMVLDEMQRNFFEIKMYKEAAIAINKRLEIDDCNVKAPQGKGLILMKLNRITEAHTMFFKAAEIGEKNLESDLQRLKKNHDDNVAAGYADGFKETFREWFVMHVQDAYDVGLMYYWVENKPKALKWLKFVRDNGAKGDADSLIRKMESR